MSWVHRLKKVFDVFTSVVLPLSSDEVRVQRLETLPPDPQYIHTRSGLDVYTLSSYKNKDVCAAIHTLKYHGNHKSIELCTRLLKDGLYEEIADKLFWDSTEIVITPVPLSKKRLRERGFNQVALILQDFDEFQTNILVRTKNSDPQTTLSGIRRLENVRGVFSVHEPAAVHGKHVVVIDDVVTTGATLSEAVKVLKNAHAKDVLPVALARA